MAQVDPPNENGSAIGRCQVWASLLAQSVQLPLGLGEGPAPGVAVAPAGAEIAAKPESNVPQQPPVVVSLESCQDEPSADHHQLESEVRPELVVTSPSRVA